MSAAISERDAEAIGAELANRSARSSYYSYFLLANKGIVPTKLHEYVCGRVQAFMEKKDASDAFDVLLISMPPQHGKSTSITETLPSWFCGLHPDKDCIIVSYSDDTASRFGRANRAKLEEFSKRPFDVVSPLFGAYHPSEPWNNSDICDDLGKYIRSRGIFGGITSNPADLIVIDDPIKTMQEAKSDTTKDSVWNEYLSSIRTRIKPRGKLIVIATRWVEDDLIGRMLLTLPGRRLETLFLPCECVDPASDPLGRALGDALCPEIGRGNGWMREFKGEYIGAEGLYTWSALYQCDPTPIAGAIVSPDWWVYYDRSAIDEKEFSNTWISVDCAFKGEEKDDYVTALVVSMIGDGYYIRAVENEHLSFTETVDCIRDLASRYPDYAGILIEDKANGSAAIDVLQKELEGIVPVTPAGGKESRLHGCSQLIRKGLVHLPSGALWSESYVREFTSFPNGKHDDEVDATTQALNYMLYSTGTSRKEDAGGGIIRITEWPDDIYEDYYRSGPEGRKDIINRCGYPKYGFRGEDE